MNKALPILLKSIKGYGNETVRVLLEGEALPTSLDDVYEWLMANKALTESQRAKIQEDRIHDARHKMEGILEDCERKGIGIITILDPEYPAMFRKMENKQPAVIYYIGNPNTLNMDSAAVIGSSNPTEKGRRVAKKLASVLASEYGLVVVSGLAQGCDTAAHEGCLSAGGKTVAVLPCGLDKPYPKSNINLAEEIVRTGGCLISEYEVGVQPMKAYFVERDRLQSGLSKAVIIAEADLDSGTMQTAGFAMKQGRQICCYIDPITADKNGGCEKLVKEGVATPITGSSDLAAFLKRTFASSVENSLEECVQMSLF